MVTVLIRMKIAVLRNGMRGNYLGRLGWGSLFGLAAVYFTFHFGLLGYGPALDANDKLAFLYGIWTLGWIFGPILFAGEDKTLLPENFRFLPITSQSLAAGLLGASLFGVSGLISLLAFSTPLFFYALQTGGIPSAIIAIPAILLQLAFVAALSRVVTSTLRKLVRSQASSFQRRDHRRDHGLFHNGLAPSGPGYEQPRERIFHGILHAAVRRSI